jgi:hypothetical protein
MKRRRRVFVCFVGTFKPGDPRPSGMDSGDGGP